MTPSLEPIINKFKWALGWCTQLNLFNQLLKPRLEKMCHSFFSFPNRKGHKYGLAIAGTDSSFGIHAQIELWQFPIYLLSISLEICAHGLLIPLRGKQFIKCAYEFRSESQRAQRRRHYFWFVWIFEWCLAVARTRRNIGSVVCATAPC